MDYERLIEFYKNRTIGERFSAAGDFVRQNWKVLFKNLLYIGIPLAILQGFFIQRYVEGIINMFTFSNFSQPLTSIFSYFGLMLVSIIATLFFYSMTGAILKKYRKGSLDENTGWSDLKQDVFSFAGKIFLQGLICSLILMVVFGILAVIMGISVSSLGNVGVGVITLIIFVLMLIIIPPLFLIVFPIFFENASAWQGLKKGFKIGFRYWGSTFLTVFLGGLIIGIVSYILLMPYVVYVLITNGETGFLAYFLVMLPSFLSLFLTPVYIIFLSLQYTSVVEKEEGISLQDKMDEFDHL